MLAIGIGNIALTSSQRRNPYGSRGAWVKLPSRLTERLTMTRDNPVSRT